MNSFWDGADDADPGWNGMTGARLAGRPDVLSAPKLYLSNSSLIAVFRIFSDKTVVNADRSEHSRPA